MTKQKYYCNPYDEEIYTYKEEIVKEAENRKQALLLAFLTVLPFLIIWLLLAIPSFALNAVKMNGKRNMMGESVLSVDIVSMVNYEPTIVVDQYGK